MALIIEVRLRLLLSNYRKKSFLINFNCHKFYLMEIEADKAVRAAKIDMKNCENQNYNNGKTIYTYFKFVNFVSTIVQLIQSSLPL